MEVVLLLFLIPAGISAQKTLIFKVKGIEFKMKPVQGGTFTMGALPHDKEAAADEVIRDAPRVGRGGELAALGAGEIAGLDIH